MMAFCPEHPKWDQNPKFIPLSETTSIPAPFIWGVPPPPPGYSMTCTLFNSMVESLPLYSTITPVTWNYEIIWKIGLQIKTNLCKDKNKTEQKYDSLALLTLSLEFLYSRLDSIVNAKGNISSETTSNKQRWRPNKDIWCPLVSANCIFDIPARVIRLKRRVSSRERSLKPSHLM